MKAMDLSLVKLCAQNIGDMVFDVAIMYVCITLASVGLQTKLLGGLGWIWTDLTFLFGKLLV